MSSNKQSGFSLIEITMALLVVAVGLTATFAMFPSGLEVNRQSVAKTDMAFFADDVLDTLQAMRHVEFDAIAPGYSFDVPIKDRWGSSTTQRIKASTTWGSNLPIEEVKYMRPVTGGQMEQLHLKYALALQQNATDSSWRVRLMVWEGRVANPQFNAATTDVFYTVLTKPFYRNQP